MNKKKYTEEIINKAINKKELINYDVISLYNVAKVIKNKQKEYTKHIRSAERTLEQEINFNFDDATVKIEGFNYETNRLKINIYLLDDTNETIIIVDEEKNILSSKKAGADLKIFLKDPLISIHDSFEKFSPFNTEGSYEIYSQNSIFLVNINSNFIEIFTIKEESQKIKDYKIKYNIQKNVYTVENLLEETESIKELFKKILINIEDCPTWMQQELKNIRNKEMKIEELKQLKEIYKEQKKQKREETKRKILSWIKK